MLNDTRIKVYVNAYSVRMDKGESMEEIDESFIKLGRLDNKEIQVVHEKVNELNREYFS